MPASRATKESATLCQANARSAVPGLAALSERFLGFAAGRRLPRFRRDAFRDDELPAPTGREGEVILYPDPFNRYFGPENLRAAVRVLRAAGYEPALARPRRGRRPLDSGRTYLAAGMVEEARAEARRLLAEEGSEAVHARLDAETAALLRPSDSQRVARALEVREWRADREADLEAVRAFRWEAHLVATRI